MSRYKAYPSYKETRHSWLESVPAHWKMLPLKFLTAQHVTDEPHETPEFIDEGVPFLSVDGIQNNQLVFEGCRQISREDHARYSIKCKPNQGDVLLGKAASVGKVAHVDTDIEFNVWSPLAVIRPRNKKTGRFIYYSLQSALLQMQCDMYSNANTQKNLGMSTIDNLAFASPTDDEAEQVANFLDHETAKIDALIEKQQRLIELLKEKRQAVISHAVTKGLNPNAPMKDSGVEWLGEVPAHWGITQIKYVAELNPRRALVELKPSLECNFVPMEKLKTESLLLDEIRTVDKVISGYTCFCDEDVLMAKVTPCFENKNMAIARGLKNGVGFGSTEIYVLRTAKHISNSFLLYRLQENEFMRMATGAMTGAGGLKRVPTDFVNSFKFAIPPIPEQRDICSFIEKQKNRYDSLESLARNQVELLQERRTALISAAVTGKIDVRDWQAAA